MALHHFDTDGGTLVVEVLGSGPLVVCSPGMGDTRDSFLPLAKHLVAHQYSVALIDPRGHGDSSAQFTHYGDEAAASDFLLVVRNLGRSRAVLAGDSFSAGAATIAAGRSPEVVAGIILLAPFLRNGMGPVGMWLGQILFWKPWGPFLWRYYATTLWPGLGDGAGERAAKSTTLLTRPGYWPAFQATVAGCDHNAVTPWIKHVKAPAIVIMGDKDPDWSDPLEEAAWVASNFADTEVVIAEGAGHAPMLERPEKVGEAVLGFVNRIRGKEGFE